MLKKITRESGWVALVALVIGAAYSRTFQSQFSSDDYKALALVADGLFGPGHWFDLIYGWHMIPMYQGLFVAQFKLWGLNPQAFFAFNLLLHLLASFVGGKFVEVTFRQKGAGVWFMLLFGLSAAHWRVPIWPTVQAHMLSSSCILLCLLSMRRFSQRDGKKFLAIAIVLHWVALLTFTMGLTLCAVVFLLNAGIWDKQSRGWKLLFRSALMAVPFALNAVANVGLRVALHGWPLKEGGGGVELIGNTVWFLLGGLGHGITLELAGVNLVVEKLGLAAPNVVWVILGLLIFVVAAFPLEALRRREFERLVPGALLVLCGMAFYILPAIPRLDWGYDYFVFRPRYLYLPSLFFIGAIVLRCHQLFQSSQGRVRSCILLAACVSLSANAAQLQRKLNGHISFSNAYYAKVEGFLYRLKQEQAAHRELAIVNLPFATGYSGWNVRPSVLISLYGDPNQNEAIEYLDEDVDAEVIDGKKVFQFHGKTIGQIRQMQKSEEASSLE